MNREYTNKAVHTRNGERFTIVNVTLGSKPSEDVITLSNGKSYKVGVASASGFLTIEDETINNALESEKDEEERRSKAEAEAQEGALSEKKMIQQAYENGMSDAITDFRGEYRFLSNFFPADVSYNGITYHNNEAAFQAQKEVSRAHEFASLTNPVQARRKGRTVRLRPDWEAVKIGIMEEIVRCKFTQNQDLRKKLLRTGDRLLIEGGRDNFWGNKRNELGKILMKIRFELRNKTS